jgi:hypothetical protein
MSANLTPEDVEYLRDGYRLFREHDPAFMERFAPDATFVFPTTLPAGGTYEGPTSGRRVAVRLAHVFTWSGEGPLAERKASSLEVICDTASFAAALAEADPG